MTFRHVAEQVGGGGASFLNTYFQTIIFNEEFMSEWKLRIFKPQISVISQNFFVLMVKNICISNSYKLLLSF